MKLIELGTLIKNLPNVKRFLLGIQRIFCIFDKDINNFSGAINTLLPDNGGINKKRRLKELSYIR